VRSDPAAALQRAIADATLPAGIPDVGEIVRWKGSAFGCRKGTTGRVKDMVSRDDGPALVIQSIWGSELTVSAKEYHFFFEPCDPQDPAYAYWLSS